MGHSSWPESRLKLAPQRAARAAQNPTVLLAWRTRGQDLG